MKSFLITFYNKGFKVCTCIKNGKDELDAMSKAGFALACKYPNVEYDNIKSEEITE